MIIKKCSRFHHSDSLHKGPAMWTPYAIIDLCRHRFRSFRHAPTHEPFPYSQSHNLNRWWNIVDWTLRNKLQWNFNRNSFIFIQENACRNVVWKIVAILFRSQRVNTWSAVRCRVLVGHSKKIMYDQRKRIKIFISGGMSKFNGLLWQQTSESIQSISRVIITHTLESLSSLT